MTFLRFKNIKNKSYAYLVKSIWITKKKGPRQKVVAYLGVYDIIGNINREAIFRRDKNRCQECDNRFNLEIDHIIPLCKGGTNDPKNLQLLCDKCNLKKGIFVPNERKIDMPNDSKRKVKIKGYEVSMYDFQIEFFKKQGFRIKEIEV